MSQFLFILIALLFVALPAVITFIRKRILQATNGLGKNNNAATDVEAVKKNSMYPFDDDGRIAKAFPGDSESMSFPEAENEAEHATRRRMFSREPDGLELSPAVEQKQENKNMILKKIDRLPPLKRAIIWTEILGVPRAEKEPNPGP